jgi:ABC-type multidrug transport system fused ATPase/permease subunit
MFRKILSSLKGLFGGTLAVSIIVAKPSKDSLNHNVFLVGASNPEQMSQEALEEACEQACILDFIRGLKDGFETEIGMKGAALSGGQRQVSIATFLPPH